MTHRSYQTFESTLLSVTTFSTMTAGGSVHMNDRWRRLFWAVKPRRWLHVFTWTFRWGPFFQSLFAFLFLLMSHSTCSVSNFVLLACKLGVSFIRWVAVWLGLRACAALGLFLTWRSLLRFWAWDLNRFFFPPKVFLSCTLRNIKCARAYVCG